MAVRLTKKFKEIELETKFWYPTNGARVEYRKFIRDGGCSCQPNSERTDGSGEKIYVQSNEDVYIYV